MRIRGGVGAGCPHHEEEPVKVWEAGGDCCVPGMWPEWSGLVDNDSSRVREGW